MINAWIKQIGLPSWSALTHCFPTLQKCGYWNLQECRHSRNDAVRAYGTGSLPFPKVTLKACRCILWICAWEPLSLISIFFTFDLLNVTSISLCFPGLTNENKRKSWEFSVFVSSPYLFFLPELKALNWQRSVCSPDTWGEAANSLEPSGLINADWLTPHSQGSHPRPGYLITLKWLKQRTKVSVWSPRGVEVIKPHKLAQPFFCATVPNEENPQLHI